VFLVDTDGVIRDFGFPGEEQCVECLHFTDVQMRGGKYLCYNCRHPL
jgi:hypothetical protein